MKLINKITFALLAGSVYFLTGCDKTEPYKIDVAPPEIHFNGAVTRTVQVMDPADPVVISIGTTDVSTSDRTITYVITSPTAVQGVQYSSPSTGTVTIPANEALGQIVVQPIPSGYPLDSRDTLTIALTMPDLKPSSWADTFTLILRGESSVTCSEDDPQFASWVGMSFDNTNELWNGSPWGPYPVVVETVTPAGATAAILGISNIWDTGWGPLSVEFNWADGGNPITSVVTGDIPGSDAGDINSAYAGTLVMARPHPVETTGTYSFCNETAVLNMQLGVSGLGWFTSGGNPILYTVTMAR